MSLAYGLRSLNTTAVKLKMSVFSSFQQFRSMPALAQVCSRNVCAVPVLLDGNLRQQKALGVAVLHEQAVAGPP